MFFVQFGALCLYFSLVRTPYSLLWRWWYYFTARVGIAIDWFLGRVSNFVRHFNVQSGLAKHRGMQSSRTVFFPGWQQTWCEVSMVATENWVAYHPGLER